MATRITINLKSWLRRGGWLLLGLALCLALPASLGRISPRAEPANPYYGLAMAMPPDADAALLGVQWYYVWGPSSPFHVQAEYIPMLWDGLPDERIPADYSGWLLVLNEPNLTNQSNVTPQEAAHRLAVLRAQYPQAKLLCCGLSVWAVDWLQAFLAASPVRPDAWHVHAYTEEWITPAKAQAYLTYYHTLTGGTYWVTEYGSPAGSLDDFQAMTTWFQAQNWITRIAPYTNRQPEGAGWAIGAGVELVQSGGDLTQIGGFYADQAKNTASIQSEQVAVAP